MHSTFGWGVKQGRNRLRHQLAISLFLHHLTELAAKVSQVMAPQLVTADQLKRFKQLLAVRPSQILKSVS